MTDPDLDPDLDLVVALERQLLDPSVRGSPAAVSALLDPGFVEFGASGAVWDRLSVLEVVAEDDSPAPALDSVAAHRVADDVILLTYRTVCPDRVTLRSSLWRHRDGQWLVFFHQGTVAPAP